MSTDKTNLNKSKKPKRRPGRDPVEPKQETVNETNQQEAIRESSHQGADTSKDDGQHSTDPMTATSNRKEPFSEPHFSEKEPQKIKLEFPGAEIIKEKAPRAFEIAESVAQEWAEDGRFENIPIPHPLAKAAAAYGLRQAKKVEKKLEEKGVFMLAKIGIDYLQSKIKK